VNRAYNNAIVLVRFLGLLLLVFGVMGVLFVGACLAALGLGVPSWLTQPAWYYASQSIISSPLYIVGGVALLWMSEGASRLLVKYCKPE
jgi:hypothetical protein